MTAGLSTTPVFSENAVGVAGGRSLKGVYNITLLSLGGQ